jgi:hypothetical protein
MYITNVPPAKRAATSNYQPMEEEDYLDCASNSGQKGKKEFIPADAVSVPKM